MSDSDINNKTWVHDDFPLYPYQPNKVLPLAAAGVFGVGFLYHVFIASKKHSWGYWWAFILGLLGEAIGYVARHISAEKPDGTKNILPYALSMLLIVLAPSLLMASVYATYHRVIRFVGEDLSPIKKVTLIFVSTDLFSIFVQGTGSSMFTSTKQNTIKLGRMLLIGGFVIQLAGIACFILISGMFYSRVRKSNIPTTTWGIAQKLLWTTSVLIFIRSVYRMLEFTTGGSNDGQQTGFLLTHEVVFYILDTVLVAIAVAVLSLGHPAFYLPRDKHARLEALPSTSYPNWPQQAGGYGKGY